MLQTLLGDVVDAGIDTRWAVVEAGPDFFAVTKRVHNRLHGARGDDGALGAGARRTYDEALVPEGRALAGRIRAGDVVLLHDPQTAGLVGTVLDAGAVPVWRCHVGLDETTSTTDEAWAFLRPDVERARASVFSRAQYRPAFLPIGRTRAIAPAIDPFAAKNAALSDEDVRAVLARTGLLEGGGAAAVQAAVGGQQMTVRRPATILREGGPLAADVPLVVQVSRWDHLKDMVGVMRGVADHLLPGDRSGAHLVLAGPSVAGVSDDPEGGQVLAECTAVWHQLPAESRRRVSLVSLPTDDVGENAVMVNALQRHARVVVQKSLAEGFGLTVAEAMWKGRPVVASAVGGLQDQVVDGETGRLIDPRDGAALGRALGGLLADPSTADRFGQRGVEVVRERFLPDRQLLQWAGLLTDLQPA